MLDYKTHMKPNETYSGVILGYGKPDYHLFLLPMFPANDMDFDQAQDWVKKVDGELPTQRELLLMLVNCKYGFLPGFYWSCDQVDNYVAVIDFDEEYQTMKLKHGDKLIMSWI